MKDGYGFGKDGIGLGSKAEKIKEAHRLLDRLDFLLAKMLRDINAAQLKKAA